MLARAPLLKKKNHFTLPSLLSGLFTFLSITFIEIAVLVLLKQPRSQGLSSSRPSERGETPPLSLGREDERPWERGCCLSKAGRPSLSYARLPEVNFFHCPNFRARHYIFKGKRPLPVHVRRSKMPLLAVIIVS